jgi:DNA-binding XRE family transcriptional regulator
MGEERRLVERFNRPQRGKQMCYRVRTFNHRFTESTRPTPQCPHRMLGKFLYEARIRGNFTILDIIRRARISGASLMRYEEGKVTPVLVVAERLARALNLSAADYMTLMGMCQLERWAAQSTRVV